MPASRWLKSSSKKASTITNRTATLSGWKQIAGFCPLFFYNGMRHVREYFDLWQNAMPLWQVC
jgi:hypothetical protein